MMCREGSFSHTMANRIAFVTSGAKGLGNATVRALLEHGWDVFFTYRSSRDEANILQTNAQASGRRVAFCQADLLDKTSVLQAVEDCLSSFGQPAALIHNFGPFVFERLPLADYTDELWDRMLTGNLTNFFWLYRALIPGMREAGFGRIVTIGYDGAGEAAGWRYRAAYAAAKSALTALTRSIAREERVHGVTGNMVCPGDIRGPHKMQKILDVEDAESRIRPPVGEDVARVIAFLCQPESQQLNGTVTEVTGGNDIRFKDTLNRSCDDGTRG